MASPQAIPEPMNSQPHHSKVKVSITLVDSTFAAGAHVGGRLEMECRADKGLGIGIMMVELFAIQELSSRDHSATSTFLHSRRLFQGPTLPPSNAVQANPMPGDPPLPQHYYQARRGHSTFLFRIPIPATSPSSISFASGLAKVRYELRASVGVFWKNEKRLVVDKRTIDVVEAYPYDDALMGKVQEATVVGENGKLWMHGRVIGSVIVAGDSACLELQVKNHSAKKNTGLTLTLKRTLYLPDSAAAVHISDTLLTVPFRGPEYIIPPGAEGVANLVFDVPIETRGVRGGTLDGEELEGGDGVRRTDSLFEIRCRIEVKLAMGMGSKDILLEIPVDIVHPIALPSPQDVPGPFAPLPDPMTSPTAYNAYYAAVPPVSVPYIDPVQNRVWLPPMIPNHIPAGYPYHSQSPAPPDPYQSSYGVPHALYNSPPFLAPPQQNLLPPSDMPGVYVQRPSSAGPFASASEVIPPVIQGLPPPSQMPYLPPLPQLGNQLEAPLTGQVYEPQEGKGERALRVTRHLRMSSRNRSVSPQSHRYPLPQRPLPIPESYAQDPLSLSAGAAVPPPVLSPSHSMAPSTPDTKLVHSPRPQLTPKHSFTHDPILGKSEHVEELEMMADAVTRRSRDLSCDLPKDILSAALSEKASAHKQKGASTSTPQANFDVNVNKTLPGPPVPSGKPLLTVPSRARADIYFAEQSDIAVEETAPLPSDQTPPTPALLAVLPSRGRAGPGPVVPKAESGLDALERRLLAEVGTRKLDTRPTHQDVRSVLPLKTSLSSSDVDEGAGTDNAGDESCTPPAGAAKPIPIPAKSPEPLHDSAISSLTLAGRFGGDDSDGDFDGRTHRAGRSHGGSSAGRGEVVANSGLHMHMRERAQGNSTAWQERAGQPDKDSIEKDKDRSKAGGRKKDRVHTKMSAKGRVAEWLGGIDPDVPPQEQVIPPSPSVLRDPHGTLDGDRYREGDGSPKSHVATFGDSWAENILEVNASKEAPSSPNPRSSGFVPISTLNRNSLQGPPLLLRDTSVTAEAQRIQDIWSSGSPPAVHALPNALFAITPRAPPIPVKADRRVSPPSADPRTVSIRDFPAPMSYSAVARSKPKTPDLLRVQAKVSVPQLPVKPPAQVPGRGRVNAVFPPVNPVEAGPKYDIRSVRGGRGGKVTAVANLWASGAITGEINGKSKDTGGNLQKTSSGEGGVSALGEPVVPPKPTRKLFSAAVMTPAPAPLVRQLDPSKQIAATTVAVPAARKINSKVAAAAPTPQRLHTDAQKRPDSRALFTPTAKKSPRASPRSSPRKMASSNALSTPSIGAPTAPMPRVQPRPATAMAAPLAKGGNSNANGNVNGKVLGPALSRGLVAPVVKGASDPAVVSSSHATPTLSTTASLARPRAVDSSAHHTERTKPIPVAVVASGGKGVLSPLATGLAPLATKVLGVRSERPTSPTKPAELAFGQARLRDLIKKYQGPGQK